MSLPSATLSSTQHAASELRRPCVSYVPNIWGETFLQYAAQSKVLFLLFSYISSQWVLYFEM